jgi:prostaglandin-endoperoxide synthase 2
MPNGECATGEFRGLSYINERTGRFLIPEFDAQIATPGLRSKLFLTGLVRGNVTPFYSAINIIFMREHNRLCREMARRYPTWDDNRLFETARNTNIVQLLKIIVEDYINHLSSAHFKVFVEPGFAEKQNWYRANRIAAEFDLLYRWHPLIPTDVILKDKPCPPRELLSNNRPLIRLGIEEVVRAAATQGAGWVMLKNTADLLRGADLATLKKSQEWRMRPYNEYRQRFDLPPVASFEELTGDHCLAAELRKNLRRCESSRTARRSLCRKARKRRGFGYPDALDGRRGCFLSGADQSASIRECL